MGEFVFTLIPLNLSAVNKERMRAATKLRSIMMNSVFESCIENQSFDWYYSTVVLNYVNDCLKDFC